MTWCDAVSDALAAQASRLDLVNGAANLNTVTQVSFATGGIIACVTAGCVEMNQGSETDPNIFFGTYAGLILILLIAAIYLNQDCEPEIVLQKRSRERILAKKNESSPLPKDRELGLEVASQKSSDYIEKTLCESCAYNVKELCKLFRTREFGFPILFFGLQGVLMPNLDDLHYVFLTQTLGI